MEFTKISSKGQVVIPRDIREKLKLKEGMLLIVIEQDDVVILKKTEIPEIKPWRIVARSFRESAKKSGFTKDDLMDMIEKVRKAKK